MILSIWVKNFDNNVLDLVKQQGFYLYEYMGDFEKFKDELPRKEKFYSFLTGKRNSAKEYKHVIKVWNKFKMKKMKDYHGLYLKMGCFTVSRCFWKI